jgi:hypothetical protein
MKVTLTEQEREALESAHANDVEMVVEAIIAKRMEADRQWRGGQ